MFLINVHKNQLRRLRHSRHVQRHGTSVKSTSTKASDDSFLSPGPDPLIRRLSFEGEEDDLDILPAMALLHNQQFLQDIMGNNNFFFLLLQLFDDQIQREMIALFHSKMLYFL